MTVTSTPIATSVHQHDENPIFGETATHVMLNDDAAGAFIILKQSNDQQKGEVRLIENYTIPKR